MDADTPLADLPLGVLLMRTGREWRRTQMGQLEPYGLVAHQAHAFWIVVRWADSDGELRLSRLAQRLHIAPRSATEVVDALEEKGLVCRVPSVTDRRATVVELTGHGRSVSQQMRGQDFSAEFFAGLDQGERQQLRELLVKVVESREATR